MKLKRAGLITILVMLAITMVSCGSIDRNALHINYSADELYGTGDYLYAPVTVTGSLMKEEKTYSVKELEELAAGDTSLGNECTYSMLTRGSVFSKHNITGLKLYDFLRYAGLNSSAGENASVRLISADGYVTVMSLGEIMNSYDNTYESMEGRKPIKEKVPVVLAFGSDGVPLVGPVGDKVPGDNISPKEGYNSQADNVGGPVRLIAGQKSANEYNAPDNAKWVRKIVVGDDANYDRHATKESNRKVLKVTVKDGKKSKLHTKKFTYQDVENAENVEENYYGSGDYYRGVNLWSFLAGELNFYSRDGTVELTYEDGSRESVDVAYFRNMNGNFSHYCTEKDGSTITNVIPALGYCINGKPSGEGLYALLPADGRYHKESTARPVKEISLKLTGGDKLRENPYGSYRISITGDGMDRASTISVNEMERLYDLKVTDGETSGISLAGLLSHLGVKVDAGKVTVEGTGKVSYDWDDLNKNRDGIFLLTREKGKAPKKGGPVKLDDIDRVTKIHVGVKDGQWTHKTSPYSKYAQSKLKISGSEAAEAAEYTIAELENNSNCVRDSFGASGGIDGYQGIVLKALIKENLKEGLKEPSSITVIGADGYSTELDVDDVFEGITSKYQPGEKRDIILAYSINGTPLVKSEKDKGYTGKNKYGPLRLIVENQTSRWVKNVKEIKIGD